MKLEEKIAKLNELAEKIEGDVPIEDVFKIFEESVALANECMAALNDCKGKLQILQEKVRLTDEN